MRKMAKGAAITGGIFSIISVLMTILTTLVNVVNFTRQGNSAMVTTTLTNSIPAIVMAILLAVILFRGKVDAFPGVVLILMGVYSLSGIVGNLSVIPVYNQVGLPVFPLILAMAANLLRGVVYILTAIHCFRKNAGKSSLYGIGFLVAALLSCVQIVTYTVSLSHTNGLAVAGPAMITLVFTVVFTFIGDLPNIFSGFAVGNAKAAAPVDPADPYGLYAKYGMQPPAAQPQYQAPQQQTWQQPQYQAPQQQTWQQPQYQAPQQQTWQQPQYQPNQQENAQN